MEDAQPNEVRLARKGSTSIPRVRTSYRAIPLYATRGRGSARKRVHPQNQHLLDRDTQNVARPVQIAQRGHHFTPVHTSARFHRNHSSIHDSRPSKRIKVESSETLPGPNKVQKASGQVLVQPPFPPGCYEGMPSGRETRQVWIQGPKDRLAIERELCVVGFKDLEAEQSVRFTCRPQSRQSIPHYSRDEAVTGSQRANAQLDTPNINTNAKDVVVFRIPVSLPHKKDRGSQRSPDRSNVAGPSRVPPSGVTRHILQVPVDNHFRRGGNQPPPESAFQKMPIGKSHAQVSPPVQHTRTSPPPRQRVSIRIDPPKEDIIDLTLDPTSPTVEKSSTRWTAFRSGTLDVSLQSSISDTRVPAPARDTLSRVEPPPHTSRRGTPASIRVTNSLSPQPNSPEDKMISVPLAAHNRPASSSLIRGCNIAGHSRDQPIVLDEEPEDVAQIQALTLTYSNLPLSLGPHDKPRRLLHETASAYVVTAHGTIDRVCATNTWSLDRNIRAPSSPLEEFVDDACMLSRHRESVMILGHARERNQLTLLRLGHGHVQRVITLRRNWNTPKKPGVSALAALINPSQFVSGGYDHQVHLWDIAEDLSGAIASELDIRHTAVVHSLLPIVDTSHKLVSVGADCNVRLFDMSSERVGHSIRTSNIPFHAHKTDFRFCTLLEVAHLDTQFELHDHRMVPDRPVQRFGFGAEEKNGRFMKGDSWSHFFACGDRNGTVRLWDLRNVSTETASLSCFKDQVMQVVKGGTRALACSRKNELACVDFQAG